MEKYRINERRMREQAYVWRKIQFWMDADGWIVMFVLLLVFFCLQKRIEICDGKRARARERETIGKRRPSSPSQHLCMIFTVAHTIRTMQTQENKEMVGRQNLQKEWDEEQDREWAKRTTHIQFKIMFWDYPKGVFGKAHNNAINIAILSHTTSATTTTTTDDENDDDGHPNVIRHYYIWILVFAMEKCCCCEANIIILFMEGIVFFVLAPPSHHRAHTYLSRFKDFQYFRYFFIIVIFGW